jgi:hypothetical protein
MKHEATRYCDEMTYVYSVLSDIPSLDSTSVSTSSDNYCSISSIATDNSGHPITTEKRTEGRVKFEHKVWVREFQRSAFEKVHMWFTRQEMHSFKAAALERILEYNIEMSSATLSASAFAATEITGSGTGRVVPMQSRNVKPWQKILFMHRALLSDSIDSSRDTERSAASLSMPLGNGTDNRLVRSLTSCGNLAAKESEVRHIMVVDSHDIWLNLFAKSLLRMKRWILCIEQ